MKNNLLFANQNKDIIREFVESMANTGYEIDTTDNGLEAAVLLQKKKYKLVVTGIDLSTYDGTKIIAYVNEYCPETLCIVYSARLELAHLKLLVNERNVFRIFKRSVGYNGELREAVDEAFTLYDKRELQAQNVHIMEKNLENARRYLAEMRQVSEGQPQERRDFARFIRSVVDVFGGEGGTTLLPEESRQLVEYEEGLVDWIMKDENQTVATPEEVVQRIRKEFPKAGLHGFRVDMERCPKDVTPVACADLNFVMHMLMARIFLISEECRIQARILPGGAGSASIRMDFVFPGKEWEISHSQPVNRIITAVTKTVLERFVSQFGQTAFGRTISYSVELKARKGVVVRRDKGYRPHSLDAVELRVP